MKKVDFDLASGYAKVLGGWYWILAAGILGGLVGLALNWLVPARYQSTALVSIGIDYGRTQFIDEDAERHIFARIQDLLLSDDVFQAAQGQLSQSLPGEQEGGSAVDLTERVRLHRIEAQWQLSALGGSPELAAAYANAWAESALQAVERAAQHAWRVAELQGAYFRVACKPGEEPTLGAVWVCDEVDPSGASNGLEQELLEEVRQSRGIPPAVSYGWLRKAVPPTERMADRRPLWAGSGALIGLVLSTSVLSAFGKLEDESRL